MNERLLNNASFSKICKILQKKESIWDEVKPLLQATMLIVPVLINKEFATMIALRDALDQGLIFLDSGNKIESAIDSIKKLVTTKDEDYIARAENAQIANVLLVFSAYFDTVKQFLPDKEQNIYLDDVQYCLTEKSLRAYQDKLLAKEKDSEDAEGRRIANWELMLPNPLEGLDEYEKRLKDFYSVLNSSFRTYLNGLSCTEDMQEHLRGELNRRLELIPDAATGNYRLQYFSLAAICPDFFVWTNQQEHQQQRELVDRGFQSLSKQICDIPEAINEYTVNETLNALKSQYAARLLEPVIPVKDMSPQDQEMTMPTREESFVPQGYEWLVYRERISVESTQNWREGREIGSDILKILRSPDLGSKPILILGDPGAGKTMLCHMLAGKILCGEYHVFVLPLRDLNAELSIPEQFGQAIMQTIGDCDCKWGNIAKAKPKKPVLLIFDGYDELLQASGKTYSDYLEKVLEFQETQWKSWGVVVRSIVTSRIVLIDKAEIPRDSVIIRLKPFDKARIDAWCEVWNIANDAYFKARELKKFEVDEGGKAWELAGEPLLLLMLALYDTSDNALRKHQNLQATELYGSLIRDFVEREKKKDPAFEEKEHKVRKREIEKEIERISIAALGMYNRKALHITSNQLDDDLKLLSTVNAGQDLRDSEKLLGSFFFIHDLTTRSADVEETEKLRAYTFLHNTFGEFLAAYYIVAQLYNLLDDLKHHTDKYEDAMFSMKDKKGWYACLSFAPLFRRPVVGQMIREWTPQFFSNKGFSAEDTVDTIRNLMNRELPRILRGEIIAELETVSQKFRVNDDKCDVDLMEHLSIYANNLLCLAALLTGAVNLDRIEEMVPRAWNKLLNLWRYTFEENEIAAFAGQFELKVVDGSSSLVASEETVELQQENDRITKLYSTYNNLHEEPARSILGALLGIKTEDTCAALREQDLRVEAKSILLGIVLERAKKDQTRFAKKQTHILSSFPIRCLNEGDYGALYGYYLVLNDIAAFSVAGARYVASMLDFELLVEVYTHCSNYFPTAAIPILELLNKLLPTIHNKSFYKLLDRLVVICEREHQFSDKHVKLLANLLINVYQHTGRDLWLSACWNLLNHAERYLYRDRIPFSDETIEKLYLLSLKANKVDPAFPLDFIDAIRRWTENSIRHEDDLVAALPAIMLLESNQVRRNADELYWLCDKILNVNDCNRLSEQTVKNLADILMKTYTQINTESWLHTCWMLLDNVVRHIHKDRNLYSNETIENLFLLSQVANTANSNFPIAFILEYARWIANRVQDVMRYARELREDSRIPSSNRELFVLVIALEIIQNSDYSHSREETHIRESADALLQGMSRKGVNLYDVWGEKPQIVLAICRTLHMYSIEVREYMLIELTELVGRIGIGMSLELYREIRTVADEFCDPTLKHALMRMSEMAGMAY